MFMQYGVAKVKKPLYLDPRRPRIGCVRMDGDGIVASYYSQEIDRLLVHARVSDGRVFSVIGKDSSGEEQYILLPLSKQLPQGDQDVQYLPNGRYIDNSTRVIDDSNTVLERACDALAAV